MACVINVRTEERDRRNDMGVILSNADFFGNQWKRNKKESGGVK